MTMIVCCKERTKGFLVLVDGKDLCLGDDQRTAGADDLASGDQPLSVGRRNEIQFVLDGQNRGAGWHHCHRRVAGGRIGNGPDDATMHKAMLLLNALPVGKMDFGAPVLNDGQRSLIRCITFCRSKLSRKRSAKCGSEKQGSRRVAGSLRCRGCCQDVETAWQTEVGQGAYIDLSTIAAGDIGALEGHRSWLANTDGRSVVESSFDCRVALRCPTYRENSHANHTWHRHSRQSDCFQAPGALPAWVRFPSTAPLFVVWRRPVLPQGATSRIPQFPQP